MFSFFRDKGRHKATVVDGFTDNLVIEIQKQRAGIEFMYKKKGNAISNYHMGKIVAGKDIIEMIIMLKAKLRGAE